MSKILVSVTVPVVAKCFDVRIPYELTINQTTDLLRALFRSEEGIGGEAVIDAIACDHSTGVPLDINRTAQELGLENGSRILLI